MNSTPRSASTPNPEDRLREMILYISSRCQFDETYGSTKLNKILFFSDKTAYLRRGNPITGVEYMRKQNGPVPRRLVPVRADMESKEELAVQKTQFHGYSQKRPISLRDANLAGFSGDEIAIVDEVISLLSSHTGRSVSDLSHGFAWKACKDQETIPFEALIVSDSLPSQQDLERIGEVVRSRNLENA